MVKAKCSKCGNKYDETWSNKYILGWMGNAVPVCPQCYALHFNKCKGVKN